jgi:uncharacterized membrane protein
LRPGAVTAADLAAAARIASAANLKLAAAELAQAASTARQEEVAAEQAAAARPAGAAPPVRSPSSPGSGQPARAARFSGEGSAAAGGVVPPAAVALAEHPAPPADHPVAPAEHPVAPAAGETPDDGAPGQPAAGSGGGRAGAQPRAGDEAGGAGAALHRWWATATSAPSARRALAAAPAFGRTYLAPAAAAALVSAYVVRFAVLSLTVYAGYGMPPYDLAIFDQGVWLLSRFHAPYVTVMGRNLFGDHTSFVLLLLVPLYWLWPHVQALLVAQTLLIAGSAVPIYLLAARFTKSRLIAVALVATYLLNPALQWGNMEQLHPECFLVPGITLAIYAAVTWRPVLLVAMVVLCLLVKEDTSLLIAPLGVWVFFRRNRSVGAAITLASLAYTALCVEVIQPAFLGGAYLYGGRIPFGGAWGTVKTLFTRPDALWDYVYSASRPWYLWEMFGAVGFGFIWAPEIAAIAGLTLLENYLSTFGYMHQILYHYSLSSVPVLVLGSAFAIGSLRAAWKRLAATGVVLGSAIAACALWGLTPVSRPIHSYVFWNPKSALVHDIDKLIDAVPPGAVISAQWPFVAHLDHRDTVYVWPNPFLAQNFGANPGNDNGPLPLVDVDATTYVLEPNPVTGQPDAAVWASIRHQFKAVKSAGGYTLWRRVRPAPGGDAPLGEGPSLPN